MIRKTLFTSFLFVILACLMSFQFLKTQLRIFVLDETGGYVENVEVSLYDTPEDYNNSKPSYGPLKTNGKGRVIFHGVKKGPY